MIPEQEVNLVNFCLPLYFFISAFISGIYRLSMAVSMKVHRTKNSSVSTTGFGPILCFTLASGLCEDQ